jgi:hypothetical protein
MEQNFAQASSDLQSLKVYSLTHLYKYLACRALALPPSSQNGLKALQFTGKYAWYESHKFSQFPLILVLVLKSLVRFLFPCLEKPLFSLGKKIRSKFI